jgi:hypothetical protein
MVGQHGRRISREKVTGCAPDRKWPGAGSPQWFALAEQPIENSGEEFQKMIHYAVKSGGRIRQGSRPLIY